MFEEVFRIIFDRRHIKDIRIWVLIILVMAEVASFWCYDKYRLQPVLDRQERQGLRIRQIIKVGRFREKIDALRPEDTPRREHRSPLD